MKGIRIEIEQPFASYSVPGSFQLRETFPLPPYSTVIGMVHNACGFKKYVDMDVSVQGNWASVCNDIYTRYEFSPNRQFEKERHQGYFEENGRKYGVVIGVGHVELLADVNLLIHIVPKNQDIVETIYNGLLYPQNFLYLGRTEDIVRINSLETVDIIEEILDYEEILKYNAYIPVSYKVENEIGTIYRLNKKYIINKSQTRYWEERIEALFAPKEKELTIGTKIYKDSKGDLVFLA
ncbi:CRISPR-associated protein Cas5 [Thermoclostridium stercorarium subsp. stercorarium DSM 8532]|uniref:CRISPR-associated protein Cas5 n=3 Tax=Thermoclostridium stercorarium TaxID=1510 RepID=L7VL34_THES1|nr:type I-B CRISPR-associated protein Cas5b [Thermoclostridium stercorarium]AGC68870.1 CRISPR-associated protein Cas5 [Thermoclostridium stercorarium subsp. stercorarium DSM 8532]AGI39868.1 CRISPR protein [Thermoclostridium stercorarium subsp. stercorarium DSM 8532]ANW99177.1 type I-B CRISPR-associated protein Cas5 [Thermoclostridium stercorarium subsp. thermolacticum DSM 2910]ANX01735.1 type I-B CRISPR-associated protein Cas5 [Thermoclostridium stercorarium subsp. leptospartum DSM 9219]UZQ848